MASRVTMSPFFIRRAITSCKKTLPSCSSYPINPTKPTAASFLIRSLSSTTTTATSPSTPIVELREDKLHPHLSGAYMEAMREIIPWRSSDLLLPQLRLFTVPETGGNLHVPTQLLYFSGGYEEREARYDFVGKHPDWSGMLGDYQACIQEQTSAIFVEAPLVSTTKEILGLESIHASTKTSLTKPRKKVNNCIYEIRRYKLKLGYDTVPKFLSLYEEGLHSKLYAEGTDPTTALVTVLYTEVGLLNEVIEVWRHGDGMKAMERSRVAARSAEEWRNAISEIAGLAVEFRATIHSPMRFSPMR